MSNDVPYFNLSRVLGGGWLIILATALVFGLLGGVAGMLWPTTYDATATVEVKSDDVETLNMQTEQTIARSTGVLKDARADLDGWSVSELRDAVTVTVPNDAFVLDVSVSASSGEQAGAAANAVAEAYLADRGDATEEQQARALTLLETQMRQFDAQIEETPSATRKQILETRLAALNEQYAAVEAGVDEPGRILSYAETPAAPSTPALYVWVAVGLVAGTLLGFYLATVRYRIRRSRGE